MRVTSASLNLAASQERTTTSLRSERLELSIGDGPRGPEASRQGSRARPASAPPPAAEPECRCEDGPIVALDKDALGLMLLLKSLARDGKEGEREVNEALANVQKIRDAYAQPADVALAPAAPATPAASAEPPPAAGWGLVYHRVEERRTEERSSFAAAGRVTTSDGRTIAFAVAQTLEHVEVQRSEIEVRAGDAAKKVDPLVLNLEATRPELQGTQSFDLDADGTKDTIARLGAGSAYLALDGNGNGRIDDGRELFGPTTGSGFAELGAHDADANGWIDEVDPVWDRLRLWRPGEGDAAGTLSTLRQENVGALSLANAATRFDLRDGGAVVGNLRASGVYLSESGEAGTVQEIDLVRIE